MPSPNMGLPIPIPSQTAGPQYAIDEQSCFNKIDAHNHTTGNGAPIPFSALTINSNISLNNYAVTNLKAIQLTNQLSSPSNSSLYMKANDLWWTNGTGLYDVQITKNGTVNVSGQVGFDGLPSGTASASYLPLSGTFQYQSATNVAAILDVGPIKLRNLTVSSNAITINAPTPLAADYNLTLPTTLPSATKIMQLDSTGQIIATLGVDDSTINISANNLQIKDGGITSAKLSPSITFPTGSVPASARLVAPYVISPTFTGIKNAGTSLFQSITFTPSATNKFNLVGIYSTTSLAYFSDGGGYSYLYVTVTGGPYSNYIIGQYSNQNNADGPVFVFPWFNIAPVTPLTISLYGNGTVNGWGFNGDWKFWIAELS